jgi:WD40 repeat protein
VFADLPTEPNALVFDPDGGLLAGGLSEEGFAPEGTTVVWNVPQRLEVARFDAGHGQVWSHWFEPSGGSVYSYGADGLHRWDLTGSHALIRTDTGHPTSFRAGDLLLSMRDDSVARWIAEACRLAGRPLSREEWSTYLGTAPYAPSC